MCDIMDRREERAGSPLVPGFEPFGVCEVLFTRSALFLLYAVMYSIKRRISESDQLSFLRYSLIF